MKKEQFPTIQKFLHSIFGEDEENNFVYHYIKNINFYPDKKLPALWINSKNRNGRLLLAKLMQKMFKSDFTYYVKSDFESKIHYNNEWAYSNLIMIDYLNGESYLLLELIKSLLTAKLISVNSKNKELAMIEPHFNFILCSREMPKSIENIGDKRRFIIYNPTQEFEEGLIDDRIRTNLEHEFEYFMEFVKHTDDFRWEFNVRTNEWLKSNL